MAYHTCDNCGVRFKGEKGVTVVVRKVDQPARYYCSDECRLGLNYRVMANSAISEAQFHVHAWKKAVHTVVNMFFVSSDGHFSWMGDPTVLFQEVEDEMALIGKAIEQFREYDARAK